MQFTISKWFDYTSFWSCCPAQCFSKFSCFLLKFSFFSRFSYWRAMTCSLFGFFVIVLKIFVFNLDEIWVHLFEMASIPSYYFVLVMLFYWELFQFVPSCYSGDDGLCRLYSMVEFLWIGWHLVKVLVFTTFFLSASPRWMYQSCFWTNLDVLESIFTKYYFGYVFFVQIYFSYEQWLYLMRLLVAGLIWSTCWCNQWGTIC